VDLKRKYEEAPSNHDIPINPLEINRKYPTFEAQIVTKYGPTVLLSIKDVL